MKKFTLFFAMVVVLIFAGTNAQALDLYAFGYSSFTSGNNLTINGNIYYNTDSGWFDNFGRHDAFNTNYIDGQCDSCTPGDGPLFHNYFAFDLANLTGAASATFNVYTFSITQSETYYLYGTSLDPSDVYSGVAYSGRTDIYDDLVSGQLLGSIYLQPGDSYSYVAITLDSAGIAWLNGRAGQGAVLGGGNEYSAPPNVPEPTTMLLLGFGLIGLAGMRRKFRG